MHMLNAQNSANLMKARFIIAMMLWWYTSYSSSVRVLIPLIMPSLWMQEP